MFGQNQQSVATFFQHNSKDQLKQFFTCIIIIGTTLWTDSNIGRVEISIWINRSRTPPFTIFYWTTSVGDPFIFERENALTANCTRTTYYGALRWEIPGDCWRWNWKGRQRGTFNFIWIVPRFVMTICYLVWQWSLEVEEEGHLGEGVLQNLHSILTLEINWFLLITEVCKLEWVGVLGMLDVSNL